MEAGLETNGAPLRASEWLAALLERPDDEILRRRFDRWLAADPVHAADWAEMARTYAVMGRTAPQYRDQWASAANLRRGDRRLPGATAAQRRRAQTSPWQRRVAIGVVAAGIAATIVLAIFPTLRWQFTADHVTATAETATIHLADGSTVRLAPESVLEAAGGGDARGVRLLRGAAFFEVVRDPSRPFKVQAESLDVTVLGTAFEVRVDESGTNVAVRRGSVQVDNRASARSQKLKAGDWVRITARGAMTHGTQPPAQVAAWLQGRLIVRDRPAGEVVDALRPYYSGIVVLRGDTLASQPLTGVYDLSDPVAALKAVASALGATTDQLSPWVLVISGG